MKKFIFLFAVVFLFAGIKSVGAAGCVLPTDCPGNGSPEYVQNVWGTTNSQIPHLKPGTSLLFRDQYGRTIDLGCPTIISTYCVDITVTQYWKERWGQGLIRI